MNTFATLKSAFAFRPALVEPSYGTQISAKASDAQKDALRDKIKDTNHDGVVSTLEAIKYALDLHGLDGSRKVSFAEELDTAVNSGAITKSEVDAFLATDTNKDGHISAGEKRESVLKSFVANYKG